MDFTSLLDREGEPVAVAARTTLFRSQVNLAFQLLNVVLRPVGHRVRGLNCLILRSYLPSKLAIVIEPESLVLAQLVLDHGAVPDLLVHRSALGLRRDADL